MSSLPAAFWLCLAGVGLGGGAALFAVWRLVSGVGSLARLRRLFSDQTASSIVEFPFAMISLVAITLLTCQLVFMASAYLVVDYASYAAVRAAIVAVPEDRSKEDDAEAANKVVVLDLSKGSKSSDIRDAAVFVCTCVSGSGVDALSSHAESVLAKFSVIKDLPGSDSLPALGGLTAYADRYLYSKLYTKARLVAESGHLEFGMGELLTVEVTHEFSLRIPVADRILGKKTPAGYVVTIKGRASMLNEGYPGEDKEPEGAATP